MTTYRVTWEIDVEADSPQEAAAEAHRLVRKPDTTATVYSVLNQKTGEGATIDLLPEEVSVTVRWGTVDPHIETHTFPSAAERDAFLQGVETMDGWMGYEVIDDD